MSNPPNTGAPLRPPHMGGNPEDLADANRQVIEPIPDKQLPDPAIDPGEAPDTDPEAETDTDEVRDGQRRPI